MVSGFEVKNAVGPWTNIRSDAKTARGSYRRADQSTLW